MVAVVEKPGKSEIPLRGARLIELNSTDGSARYAIVFGADRSYGITARLAEKVGRIVEDLGRHQISLSAISDVILPPNATGQVASNLRSLIRRKIGNQVSFIRSVPGLPDLSSEKLPEIPRT